MRHRAPYLVIAVLSGVTSSQAQAQPNLSGQWARLEVTTALSKVPVLGDLTAETRAWTIVTLEHRGDRLTVKEQLCALDNQTLGGVVKTIFPPAFLAAVSGLPRTARLEASPAGLRYRETRPLHIKGATLVNPETDPLPRGLEDPRVEDTDGDGQPGLTVRIEGFVEGDVYVVQRDRSELRGEVHSSGQQIKGLIRWSVEQSVIGASREMLASTPDSRPHPEAKRSYFRMRRIPNQARCADVLQRRRQLFGPQS